MEALELSEVFPVQRSRLTAVEDTPEYDCCVHIDFHGQLHVPTLHNLGTQAIEGLASFTDTSHDLFVDGNIRFLK